MATGRLAKASSSTQTALRAGIWAGRLAPLMGWAVLCIGKWNILIPVPIPSPILILTLILFSILIPICILIPIPSPSLGVFCPPPISQPAQERQALCSLSDSRPLFSHCIVNKEDFRAHTVRAEPSQCSHKFQR